MKIFLSVVFSVGALSCFAQKPAIEKAKNFYFYKKDGITEVATKDSAEYIEVITEPDKGDKLFDVKRFYKDARYILWENLALCIHLS